MNKWLGIVLAVMAFGCTNESKTYIPEASAPPEATQDECAFKAHYEGKEKVTLEIGCPGRPYGHAVLNLLPHATYSVWRGGVLSGVVQTSSDGSVGIFNDKGETIVLAHQVDKEGGR